MLKSNWRKIGLAASLSLSLVLAACGSSGSNGGDSAKSGDGSTGNGDAAQTTSLGAQLDYTITGIDAGAGIMSAAEKALTDYENLKGWNLQTSSSAAMTKALGDAIKNKEPIIVTGWTPHWMFAKYDLKYLDDPKGDFGGEEQIHTIGRKGLDKDLPNAYKVLDQFNWTAEDMGKVMLAVNEGTDVKEAAATWIKDNQTKVDEWTKGAEKVDGTKITLAYVAWDSEIASTNVIGQVLENQGFKVDLKQVEAGPMWAAVAGGDADAIVAAWLPGTHAKFFADYKADIIDMGVNLEGAKIGLVVPKYVEANSIADLEPKK